MFLSEKVSCVSETWCLQLVVFRRGPASLPLPFGRTKIWPNISKDLLETACQIKGEKMKRKLVQREGVY